MNILLISFAFVGALLAIYFLYAIIMYQGGKNTKGGDLQLSTKNILEQVQILFNKNEFALVQLLATKYLERVPSHQEVRKYLSKAYYKDKKYNNAIKQCLIILKKDSSDIYTRKLLGDCYIKKDMLAKAVKEYEQIFEHKSNDKDIVRTLAELYRDTEQTFSSISVYNILSDLMDNNEDIADVQLILAELNEEIHDYPAAFEAYKTRLGIYPTDISTNQQLINLYIKLKNFPKAIETLLYMLTFTVEPKILQWVYENLINIYVETEEYEKAIEYSNKLLDTQGSDKFKVRSEIAMLNIKLDKYTEGIAILEDLVLMSQNGYDVTIQLCDSYKACNNYEKALEKYLTLLDKANQKEAKDLSNYICNLFIEWSLENTKNKNYDEAYKHLEEAMEYNPVNSEIYYHKALNNIEQKNYTESVDLLQKALEMDKNKTYYPKYLLALSEAHHQLGNFFEEKKALSDLLKIDGKNPMGLYRYGLMYITQHDVKNAEEYFKKSLQYDPGLINAKYNLALIYESNNRDKAKELYIEVLEQDPTYEEAKRALADLATSDF